MSAAGRSALLRSAPETGTDEPMDRLRDHDRSPGFPRRYRNWTWAFVGQSLSSATTLGLSILAGRALGVSALGVVAIGLGAYFILLSLQRALVTTPLISSSSNDADTERASATRAALTLTLTMGAIGAGLLAVVGLTIGGPIGDGMLVFAPWLAPTLTQDLLRTSLFRDGHGRAATLTDIAWFGTLLVCVPLAVSIGEIWAVVGAWGLGGLVAASLAGAVMRITPASPSVARTWFVGTAFPFGRWLLLQEGSFVIGFYGLVLLLTPILGATGLGGLRAAETIFAPMSLLAPALVVVGLPAVSRALSRSDDSAIKLAAGISGACVLLIIVYSGVMVVAGPSILTRIFGDAFEPYGDLVVPMSIWQLTLALGLGFTILLRGQQRGKVLLLSGTSMALTALVVSPVAAALEGVRGAVWGYISAAAVYGLLVVWFGLRGVRLGRRS